MDCIPESEKMSEIDLMMQRVMLGQRKRAELTIRAVKDQFQRLNTVLKFETQKREISMELTCRLLNLRTKKMDRSQNLTT